MRTSPGAMAAKGKIGTDWARLQRMTDAEIRAGVRRDPDARATDAEFWKKGRLVMPEPKKSITIRLDADILRFFKRKPRYQTRINAVLRSYMRGQTGG